MHNVGPLIRPFIRVSVSKTLPNGMGMARVPVRRNLQHWGTVTLRNEEIPILHLLLLLPLRRLHRFTFRKLLRWTDHPAVPCAAPRSQPVVLRGFQATILIAETTNLVPRGDRESAAGMTTMRRQKKKAASRRRHALRAPRQRCPSHWQELSVIRTRDFGEAQSRLCAKKWKIGKSWE